MPHPDSAQPHPAAAEPSPELAQYGIARIVTERFEVGGYRYTNLADAVAQAKRSREAQA